MIILISPSKTLDFSLLKKPVQHSIPLFLKEAGVLAQTMKKQSVGDLRNLLGISQSLAQITWERFQSWSLPHDEIAGKPAMMAFKGDVYKGLMVDDFGAEELDFAQNHLRILSGLYGYLKPLDVILPHRLEMGTRLVTKKFVDLYDFWRGKVTNELLSESLKFQPNEIVNLASKEYADVIDFSRLNLPLIQPVFMDYSSGKYRIISYYAKKARGMMARFAIKNKITDAQHLKHFNMDSYFFSAPLSNENHWVFTRG
jgi:uncharacterized protein